MANASEAQATLFDEFTDNYEAACESGLRLSGEGRDFFANRRVELTRRLCVNPDAIGTILDFGCGLGHTTPHFLRSFPRSTIVGLDTSTGAIAAARRTYGQARVDFISDDRDLGQIRADLAYSNGVFHHIEPNDRAREVMKIRTSLVGGGLFAFWENNPWNAGTRLVMKRIPFDRDAKLLSYREAEALLVSAGFRIVATSFHFYFPSWLKPLRSLEPFLTRVPLGAQYCVLAQKPAL